MIERIKLINELLEADLPRTEFAVAHSAWLALMGMRRNGDIDLLMTSRLREKLFPDCDPELTHGIPGPMERRIRFHPENSLYATFYGASSVDDVIGNFTVEFDGVRFVEPRFYFMFKKKRMERVCLQKQSMSLWQKSFGLPIGRNKAMNRKLNKDRIDFAAIIRFLEEGYHKRPEFAHISDAAWGFPDLHWLPDNLSLKEVE